jgi:hypothetical protein
MNRTQPCCMLGIHVVSDSYQFITRRNKRSKYHFLQLYFAIHKGLRALMILWTYFQIHVGYRKQCYAKGDMECHEHVVRAQVAHVLKVHLNCLQATLRVKQKLQLID